MAKHVVITDDITGEPGAETHLIIVDGKGIEIDLAEKSITRLVKALEPFWAAAGSEADYEVTRRTRGRSTKGQSTGRAVTQNQSAAQLAGVESRVIREWAAKHHVEVPRHGRVPQPVVDQYLASNGHR